MGAGQIGGIATLLDIDFENPAEFQGGKPQRGDAQYIVYFFSHAMMFCVGSLLEAHVVLTPAICVFGERFKFDVYGGTHRFLAYTGVPRTVHHVCTHRGYNHTNRWRECSADNMALLVLNKQFSFHQKERESDFFINRVRYGNIPQEIDVRILDTTCKYFGWGSRRNGYLIPLLIYLQRVDVTLLSPEKCLSMWNYQDKYLCIVQPPCKSSRFGALCPDDVGSLIECSGFAHGMMTSRLVDRPCGVGFLDLTLYSKFLTCGVDSSRNIIEGEEMSSLELVTQAPAKQAVSLVTMPGRSNSANSQQKGAADKKGDSKKQVEVEQEVAGKVEAEAKEKVVAGGGKRNRKRKRVRY